MAKRTARWLALASVLVSASVLATWTPETRAAPASVVVAERALPLRHFPWSRATSTDAEGYYHQPAGLSDDFPEGTTTLANSSATCDAMPRPARRSSASAWPGTASKLEEGTTISTSGTDYGIGLRTVSRRSPTSATRRPGPALAG